MKVARANTVALEGRCGTLDAFSGGTATLEGDCLPTKAMRKEEVSGQRAKEWPTGEQNLAKSLVGKCNDNLSVNYI